MQSHCERNKRYAIIMPNKLDLDIAPIALGTRRTIAVAPKNAMQNIEKL